MHIEFFFFLLFRLKFTQANERPIMKCPHHAAHKKKTKPQTFDSRWHIIESLDLSNSSIVCAIIVEVGGNLIKKEKHVVAVL